MTFLELQDDALERLEYSTATSTSPRTRIKRLLNQTQRDILTDPKYAGLRVGRLPLVTVASQVLYGSPVALTRIDDIYDSAGENPRLTKRTKDWLRMDNRADYNEGTPGVYVEHGLKPIYRYPAITGSGLWAVSTDATDTTQTVTIQGKRVDGFDFNPSAVTLTGTTRVAIGTRTDYVDVTRIRLSATCAGDVRIYDAASNGNLLGVIPIGKTSQLFTVIQLYPVANTVYTYIVEGELAIVDMSNNLDEPVFKEDFHHILSLKVIEKELREIKKQVAQADAIYKMEIKPMEDAMVLYDVKGGDNVVVPDDGRSRLALLGSNLGSWFPRGRW